MRAAVYLRQSKDFTGEELAISRQRDDCHRLAGQRGWDLAPGFEFIDNDLSAATAGKRRPGFEAMLAAVAARKIDVVIARDLDRLTRNMGDLELLISTCEKAEVVVITSKGDIDLTTDAGQMIARVLGSVATMEIKRKANRQRSASAQAAESGKLPRRRAFGFQPDGTHDPVEAPALIEVYNLVIGGMSVLAAMRWLNEHGHATTTGRPWDRSSVAKMIRNPRNTGLRTLRGEIVTTGKWEPIVPEETWRAAVEAITDRSRAGRSNVRRWLGGGTYRCHCGSPVRVNYSHHRTRVYQCQRSHHLSRAAEPIDALVDAVIVARLRRPDIVELLAPPTADMAPLRSEAKLLRLRSDQLAVDYAEGLLTGRQLKVATAKVEGRLAEVEQALADAGRGSRLSPLLATVDPGQAWLDADLSVRQAVLETLCTVTLLPGTPGRAPFNPETVTIDWC